MYIPEVTHQKNHLWRLIQKGKQLKHVIFFKKSANPRKQAKERDYKMGLLVVQWLESPWDAGDIVPSWSS